MQQSLMTAEVAPTIAALQEHLETVRQTELDRVRRRPVGFRPEQEFAIEDLSRGIVTRILHGSRKFLEAASEDKESAALLSIVHRIFNLSREQISSQADYVDRIRRNMPERCESFSTARFCQRFDVPLFNLVTSILKSRYSFCARIGGLVPMAGQAVVR
jgi:hypothetical protein